MATPFVFRVTLDFRIEADLFSLKFERTDKEMPFYRNENGCYTVFLPILADISAPRYQRFCNMVIQELLRDRARQVLPQRVAELTSCFGLRYNRVTVKNVRTRWGSCSSLGNINFSFWLLLAPLRLVDYVVTHELAHLNEMNHGPRFWAEVDRLNGGEKGIGRRLEKEMKQFSRTLLLRYFRQG